MAMRTGVSQRAVALVVRTQRACVVRVRTVRLWREPLTRARAPLRGCGVGVGGGVCVWAQLQVILQGLARGIQSVGYVVLMLLIVLYIFAVIAMLAFAQYDPFAYPSLAETLVSLFRAATLEDWTDLMYVSIYGCTQERGWTPGPMRGRWLCQTAGSPSVAGQLGAVVFWISFVIVASFVMLSLFVGAITVGMGDAVEEVEREKEEAEREKNALRQERIMERRRKTGQLSKVTKLWEQIGRRVPPPRQPTRYCCQRLPRRHTPRRRTHSAPPPALALAVARRRRASLRACCGSSLCDP